MFSGREQYPYTHTHTHTYRANTRPAHVETKERERLHIRVTTISWTYRRQTFGKETDGENESSSRGWMGLVTLMRRRQRNRGHLPYGYTHTHMCTQWGSDSQPPFEISSSRILYTLPSCHFLTHFSLYSSRSGEETETRVRSGVNFFFFFVSPFSFTLELIDGLIDNFFQHSVSVVELRRSVIPRKRKLSASQKWPSLVGLAE